MNRAVANRLVNLDELAARGPAQRALVRVLRMAVPDEDHCVGAISMALQAAGADELPSHTVAIRHFVRGHLAPHLTDLIGTTLVVALIDDLSADLEQLESGHVVQSETLRSEPPVSADRAVLGRLPFSKLRRSVTNLVRTASTRLRAVVTSAPASPAFADGRLARIVVVHADRLARASLSRAFVTARFDVEAFDSLAAAAEMSWSRHERLIVVSDVMGGGAESWLPALVRVSPGLRVLAWTDEEVGVVANVLRAAAIERFAVASSTASPREMVDAARRFLSSS